jgi:hypothetical protein
MVRSESTVVARYDCTDGERYGCTARARYVCTLSMFFDYALIVNYVYDWTSSAHYEFNVNARL